MAVCAQIVDSPDTDAHSESVTVPLVRPHGDDLVTVSHDHPWLTAVTVLLFFDEPEDDDDDEDDDDTAAAAMSTPSVLPESYHVLASTCEVPPAAVHLPSSSS